MFLLTLSYESTYRSRLFTNGSNEAEETKSEVMARPLEYKEEFCQLAENLSLLGLNNEEIAKAIGCNPDTIYDWKNKFPAFSEALTRGKVEADGKIARALYKRALGLTITEEAMTKDGIVVELRKELPPDTAAAKHWLGNRQRALWGSNGESTLTITEPLVINRTQPKDDNA